MKNQSDRDYLPLDRYHARRGEVQLHMSHFCLGYLNSIYKTFDGDLALVIVLGEISHHNTAHIFSPEELSNPKTRSATENPGEWDTMAGCNAYSLSCATGIPRETIRRKISTLKRRGWIESSESGGLRITPACGDDLGPDLSLSILRGLLKAARAIEHILAEDPPNEGTAAGKKAATRVHSKPSAKDS